MKLRKKIVILFSTVMMIAAVLNILYILDLTPEWSFRLGFIAVMLCSVIMNISNIIKSKKTTSPNNVEILSYKKGMNKILIWLLPCVALIWISTYIIAEFTK